MKVKKRSRLPTRKVTFVADTNLAVHVTDFGKAEDFYGHVLRSRLLKRTAERLVCDAAKITLYVVKDEKVTPFTSALEVDDYERAKQYLVKNGCRIIREWSQDRALYFEDPFGIVMDIVEKPS